MILPIPVPVEWQLLSISDVAGLLQAIVALVSLLLLFKTIKLHKNANEQQKYLLDIERKAKRAAYMPDISFSLELQDFKTREEIKNKIAVAERRILIYRLTVKENSVTQIRIDYDKSISKLIKPIKQKMIDSIYKKGDFLEDGILQFRFSDFSDDEMNINQDVHITIKLSYEDLIGNRYLQEMNYNLRTRSTNMLSLRHTN